MFSKNLKYYRLKRNLNKKQLAELANVTPMAITHYENGDRQPNMETIKALATALNVRVSDFLVRRNENLEFQHGEFRKKSKLTQAQQEFMREEVEEHFSRFYFTVEILGGEVLPPAPKMQQVALSKDVEADAREMRKYLGIAESGPVGNLIELLENRGILVYVCDIDSDSFSGMNGSVNGRPYVLVNGNMTPERIRSTIAHEMAHFIFKWDEDMSESDVEDMATAISGAFLLPKVDAIRELGVKRTAITKDMDYTCKEYGISKYLLAKRARLCGIVNDSAEKNFYIMAAKKGWRKNEPVRIANEEPTLFAQLVFRAVCESEISVQKGAELLKMTYTYVADKCFVEEV